MTDPAHIFWIRKINYNLVLTEKHNRCHQIFSILQNSFIEMFSPKIDPKKNKVYKKYFKKEE
jgi:hypothetical protein